jgi:hypothetical protein
MEVSDQLHAPPALIQGKSPWYPFDRRLGGPPSRSGRGGEEKNFQSPPGIEPCNPDCPARSGVAIPTELSRLFLSNWYRDVKLTTHFHLVLSWRMRGSVPPLPQYMFMAWCLVKPNNYFVCTFSIVFVCFYVCKTIWCHSVEHNKLFWLASLRYTYLDTIPNVSCILCMKRSFHWIVCIATPRRSNVSSPKLLKGLRWLSVL